MTTTLQIVRKSSFKEIPWKNGGGVTHEAIRVPAGGDTFLWRVSMAHIDASGPFSDFTGYRRNMVLLQGRGLLLKFDGGENCLLQKAGDSAQFDGAVSTNCELLDGPCVDLNFMVSKSVRADARVVLLDQDLVTPASPVGSALIFSVEAPLLLEGAGLEPVRLEHWDLAVVSQGSARLSRINPEASSAPCAVFFATINN
jgi:environmental stress-induced protein Ves